MWAGWGACSTSRTSRWGGGQPRSPPEPTSPPPASTSAPWPPELEKEPRSRQQLVVVCFSGHGVPLSCPVHHTLAFPGSAPALDRPPNCPGHLLCPTCGPYPHPTRGSSCSPLPTAAQGSHRPRRALPGQPCACQPVPRAQTLLSHRRSVAASPSHGTHSNVHSQEARGRVCGQTSLPAPLALSMGPGAGSCFTSSRAPAVAADGWILSSAWGRGSRSASGGGRVIAAYPRTGEPDVPWQLFPRGPGWQPCGPCDYRLSTPTSRAARGPVRRMLGTQALRTREDFSEGGGESFLPHVDSPSFDWHFFAQEGPRADQSVSLTPSQGEE